MHFFVRVQTSLRRTAIFKPITWIIGYPTNFSPTYQLLSEKISDCANFLGVFIAGLAERF